MANISELAWGSSRPCITDLRECNYCHYDTYIRKTGCVNTCCSHYYMRLERPKEGPWHRGKQGGDRPKRDWSWSDWTKSTTAAVVQEKLLEKEITKIKQELESSSSEEEASDSDEAAGVAGPVKVSKRASESLLVAWPKKRPRSRASEASVVPISDPGKEACHGIDCIKKGNPKSKPSYITLNPILYRLSFFYRIDPKPYTPALS